MIGGQRNPVPVNPDVLVWARERSGLTVDDAAAKIRVKPGDVAAWESGDLRPSASRGRKLAKAYGRPFLEFFSDDVPRLREVELVADFRMKSREPAASEKRGLRDLQAWAEELRINALALIEELDEESLVLSSNLGFRVEDDVENAAEVVREAISLTIEEQLNLPRKELSKLSGILRGKIERMGVLVLKRNDLDNLGARGICLYSERLPVIVICDDSANGQVFTLMHEFAHVLLKVSAISDGSWAATYPESGGGQVESWCNRFAASFLVPKRALERVSAPPASPMDEFDDGDLERLARNFGVSRHAMLVRLVTLDYVKPEYYWQKMRPIFMAAEAQPPGPRMSEYYGKRYVNRNGNFYTGLVLEAWSSDLITSHNAAEYMGITNLTHLVDIRERFGS